MLASPAGYKELRFHVEAVPGKVKLESAFTTIIFCQANESLALLKDFTIADPVASMVPSYPIGRRSHPKRVYQKRKA